LLTNNNNNNNNPVQQKSTLRISEDKVDEQDYVSSKRKLSASQDEDSTYEDPVVLDELCSAEV
jgi:hypothetical protein